MTDTEKGYRLVYITAGAAGMYCGSCMHDNTLVAALRRLGHDAILLPTYTPISTDEASVSEQRVFFGGINVYLQQKSWLFRWTPWFLDRLLDFPRLLRWVSKFAVKTEADQLGELTISMLKGSKGKQQKEVKKLVHHLKHSLKPHLINMTNALLSGMVPDFKKELNVPVLCTLQGDDIYTESLSKKHRDKCLELIRENCKHFDGFITTSQYYADFMTEYFKVPREKIDIVYPGLKLEGHGQEGDNDDRPLTIGYFARICHEKGLHNLVEAFCQLKKMPEVPECRLKVSGWFGENNREYFEKQKHRLAQDGLEMEHVESPTLADKIRFLQSIDILSVPTTYHEPKGLYLLEAWANSVPVVQPTHGSFPELVKATEGGLLVEPNNPIALAEGLHQLLTNDDLRHSLGQNGKRAVFERFHDTLMAEQTARIYERYLSH